jgi:HK97 family phage major capsid protein
MWIELTSQVADKKPGEFIDVEEGTARAYVAAGLAKDAGDGPDKIILQRSMEHLRSTLSSFTREVAAGINEAAQEAVKAARPSFKGYGDIQVLEQDHRSVGNYIRDVIFALGSPDPDQKTESFKRLVLPWREGGYGCKRALNEATGGAGGFTTPTIYEQEFFRVAAEEGVFAPYCRQVPLGARTVEWPALDQTVAASTGQSTFFGGVKVFRKREADQRSTSQPAFAKIALNAIDLTAYTEMSRDVVMDSMQNIDALTIELMGQAIGWREDYECLVGSGSGEFQGIFGAPCTIAVTRNTGSTIKYQDIFGMYKRLLPRSMKSPATRWIIHPYSLDTLMTIQDPSTRFVMMPYPIAGPEGTLQGAISYRLLGLPVVMSEKVPVLGQPGDLMLVDPGCYLLGRRSGLEIGLSEHFKFDTDTLALRAKIRNDGQPWLKKYITLMDGASTLTGFAYLN